MSKYYQTSFYENMNIYNYGCLMMSLVEIGQRMADRCLSKEQILFLYDHLIKQGHMNETCYVLNHKKVIDDTLSLLIKPEIRAEYVGAQYTLKTNKSWGKHTGDFMIIQVKTEKGHSHFRLIDYDPYRPNPVIKGILSVRYYNYA